MRGVAGPGLDGRADILTSEDRSVEPELLPLAKSETLFLRNALRNNLLFHWFSFLFGQSEPRLLRPVTLGNQLPAFKFSGAETVRGPFSYWPAQGSICNTIAYPAPWEVEGGQDEKLASAREGNRKWRASGES